MQSISRAATSELLNVATRHEEATEGQNVELLSCGGPFFCEDPCSAEHVEHV